MSDTLTAAPPQPEAPTTATPPATTATPASTGTPPPASPNQQTTAMPSELMANPNQRYSFPAPDGSTREATLAELVERFNNAPTATPEEQAQAQLAYNAIFKNDIDAWNKIAAAIAPQLHQPTTPGAVTPSQTDAIMKAQHELEQLRVQVARHNEMYQRMRMDDDRRVAADRIAQYKEHLPYISAFPDQQRIVDSVVKQFNAAVAADNMFDRRTVTEKENMVRQVLANIETTLAMTVQAYGGKLPTTTAPAATPNQPTVVNDQSATPPGVIPPRYAFGPNGEVYERSRSTMARPESVQPTVIPNGAPPPAPSAASPINDQSNGFPRVASGQNLANWFAGRLARGR